MQAPVACIPATPPQEPLGGAVGRQRGGKCRRPTPLRSMPGAARSDMRMSPSAPVPAPNRHLAERIPSPLQNSRLCLHNLSGRVARSPVPGSVIRLTAERTLRNTGPSACVRMYSEEIADCEMRKLTSEVRCDGTSRPHPAWMSDLHAHFHWGEPSAPSTVNQHGMGTLDRRAKGGQTQSRCM
jgi:hypothetical protein